MLSKLDPDDLKAVLQNNVDDKPIYEHVKISRDKLKDDQDHDLKTEFTDILHKGGFGD
jgi:hypothetical protein